MPARICLAGAGRRSITIAATGAPMTVRLTLDLPHPDLAEAVEPDLANLSGRPVPRQGLDKKVYIYLQVAPISSGECVKLP